MLMILALCLLLGSVFVFCVKRSRESLLLTALCLSLTVYFLGILVYIAKKGGYSPEILRFLFCSNQIRTWVQYRFITFNQLGYIIAIGRFLFPPFLLAIAMHYSMLSCIRQRPLVRRLIWILPGLTLLIYWPGIYRWIIALSPWVQKFLASFSYYWILCYVALALILLVQEFLSITISFFRRQFSRILVCMAALSALFLLYCGQDPGQVYSFYSYNYIWARGIGYLQFDPSLSGLITLVLINVVCSALGIVSLFKYTQDHFADDHADVVLERNFDVARTGASVFVHSIKNQLLANRVLYKRIHQELEQKEPDLNKLRGFADSLTEINEQLISRSEDLYRTVKAKSVQLVPVELGNVEATTLDRFRKKYPEARLETKVEGKLQVLADENYLSEALYNLLTNAWEANLAAGHGEAPIKLLSHQERLYTVLEVRDAGPGIKSGEMRRIFEPFYSNKNSNFNWGMGLYHTRAIVKSHLGSLRAENRREGGASFFVLLPRYDTIP